MKVNDLITEHVKARETFLLEKEYHGMIMEKVEKILESYSDSEFDEWIPLGLNEEADSVSRSARFSQWIYDKTGFDTDWVSWGGGTGAALLTAAACIGLTKGRRKGSWRGEKAAPVCRSALKSLKNTAHDWKLAGRHPVPGQSRLTGTFKNWKQRRKLSKHSNMKDKIDAGQASPYEIEKWEEAETILNPPAPAPAPPGPVVPFI